jgi:type I restriction enzyme M protein
MARINKTANGSQATLFMEVNTPKEVFRYLRNYLAGQYIGATRDDALLDEVLKCLFCKLYLETSQVEQDSSVVADSFARAQFYRNVFQRVRQDYPEIYDEGAEILLDPANLDHVIRSLDFALLTAESDPIGDAYEVFAGSESRARSGQFFTPRNATDLLVEAIDPKPGEKIIDPACGAGGFLASAARHLFRQGLSARQVADAARNFVGIEKDDYLTRLARLHVSLLTCGHPTIICGDSLALRNNGTKLETLIPVSEYDVVLTNPPFGVKIVAASAEVLRQFELACKWKLDASSKEWRPVGEVRQSVPPQVLFVERCLSLLRDGGRLGMVVPESVLSNKSYRHVVEYLKSRTYIDAVIGMPESLFKTSGKGGTHTKTCLLVATKGRGNGATRSKVFMAEAKWCGKDSRAREIDRDDLPEISKRFSAFKGKVAIASSHLGFLVNAKDVLENVLCPRYYEPELALELERLTESHDMVRFGDLVSEGCLTVTTGDEVGKLAYSSGGIPFVRTSDLSTWEIKVDPKHCVDERVYRSLKSKQDVRRDDILMVKDGTYLIGTCAIVTEYDEQIVYQSHLYKIRVTKEKHGINAFLLLALLSSGAVQRQIRAKQFTQDIIDSLGERISELMLPIPRLAKKREQITEMVRQVIKERVEARELARRAVVEVLGY